MKDNEQQRLLLAQQAARIMAETGITDFAQAKAKAADQLHISRRGALPSNREIEEALKIHYRTFLPEHHQSSLNNQREAALRFMESIRALGPQLTGAVLNGTASENSPIDIWVTAETIEEVGRFLLEQSIPYRIFSCELRTGRNQTNEFHGYRFEAGDHTFRLTVFTEENSRQKPLDPTTGKAAERASISQLRSLLKQE